MISLKHERKPGNRGTGYAAPDKVMVSAMVSIFPGSTRLDQVLPGSPRGIGLACSANRGFRRERQPAVVDHILQPVSDHIQCRRIHRILIVTFGLEAFGF